MKHKILLILSFVLVQNMFAAEGEFLVKNTRFYSVCAADIDQDGKVEIIAGGQLNHGSEKNHSAYIAVFRHNGGSFTKVSDVSFKISDKGANISTRIRDIQTIAEKDTEGVFFVTSGRAGEDENGMGFIQYGRISQERISLEGRRKFFNPRGKYTHGYPLAIGNLNNDRKPEIVYGGFVGTEKGDWADIHVFGFEKGTLKEDRIAFSSLKIPLRVNALKIGDIDGDNNNDIVIAGRTKKSNGEEYSAFAWESQGKTCFHVFDDEFPGRLRTLLIIDINQDGKNELITGGRQEFGIIWAADLRIWKINNNNAILADRFFWSSGHQMRLRSISPIQNKPNHIRVAGRIQHGRKDGSIRWFGFIGSFGIMNDSLQPVCGLELFDFGQETRIRDLFLTQNGHTILAGFGKTKSGENFGFIRLISVSK